MNKMFKYSTIIVKIVIASLLMTAFMVTLTKVHAETPNEELVIRSIRNSLWYEGALVINNKKQEVGTLKELYPEELYRALEKHDNEKKVSFVKH